MRAIVPEKWLYILKNDITARAASLVLLLVVTLVLPITIFIVQKRQNITQFASTSEKTAVLSLSPSSSTLSVGSTITLDVVIDTKGALVTNADIAIIFDPAKLQAVSITPGNFLSQVQEIAAGKVIDNTNGIVRDSFFTTKENAQIGTGTFATIVFAGKSAGNSTVTFDNTKTIIYGLQKGDVFASGTPATITVTANATTTKTAQLAFNLILPGIGNGNDEGRVIPNTNNLHRQTRAMIIELFSANNTALASFSGQVTYQQGNFKGTIATSLPQGQYKIKVKMPGYLKRRIGRLASNQLHTITPSTTTTLPIETLIPGDITNDGKVDTSDTNIFQSCFGKNASISTNCTLADYNDNGVVDSNTDHTDYTLLLKGSQKVDE